MNGLSPVEQKFVLHWGEMSTRWGINRTVAQVHALLFLAPAAWWLATVVLRVETAQGTLVVEINDPETEARIKNGIPDVTHVAIEDLTDHLAAKQYFEVAGHLAGLHPVALQGIAVEANR